MTAPRPALAALLIGLATVSIAACGEERADSEPAPQEDSVTVEGITYEVRLARQLNPRAEPDDSWYRGDDPPPGRALVGVLLRACNATERAQRALELELRTQISGSTYRAKPDLVNPAFAYEPVTLDPGRCVPRAGSPARSEGAVAVFELPVEEFRNRQVVLAIGAARIELDL